MTPSLESLEKSLDKQLRDARPERLEKDAEGRYICPKCGAPKTYKQIDWRYKICGECSDYELDPRRLAEAANAMSAEIEEERKRKVQRKKAAAGQKRRARERKKEETVEDKIQQELASRELARRSLLHYIERTLPNYEAGWVHEDICRRLEKFVRDVEEKKSPRLILAMPPRHGKSQIASISFPAWILGKHPDWEFIMASYATELPLGFSRKVRAQIQSAEYKNLFPNTHLSKDSQAAESWRTTKGGGLRAAGCGSGITGLGATVLVIDDPLRDSSESDSEVARQNVHDWYSSTAYTRLAPGGGVLCIQCLTGDTPVRMADGTDRRLDCIRKGDRVATFDRGVLSTATVTNWASQGYDDVFVMTTISGKIVRANERHPFLVFSDTGELEWTRLKNLRSGHKIVVLKDNGVNGGVKPAVNPDVVIPRAPEECAHTITTNGNGRQGTDPRRHCLKASARRILNTATGLLSRITSAFWISRTVGALSVGYQKTKLTLQSTGSSDSASITTPLTTTSEDFSVTTATCSSNGAIQSKFSSLHYDTDDFTTDEIVSIEPAGRAEVFDLQIDCTENFIANVIVVHNTRWHDDDLAGRLERQMNEAIKEINLEELDLREALLHTRNSAEQAAIYKRLRELRKEYDTIDKWEVVSYPAIATHDEYLNRRTGEIVRAEGQPLAIQAYLPLRKKGEALHPERFPEALLMKYKRTLQPRHWSALYQQQPTPDEGSYFTKDMFRIRPTLPDWSTMYRFAAWDLAIGVKTTNDWTVGIVVGLDHDDNLWVLDLIRGRWGDTDKIASLILDTSLRYECVLTGLEKGQLEMAIKPHLDRLMKQRRTYIPLAEGESALKPITDKLVRARTLQGRMQQGTVLFPGDQPWIETIQHELLRFPTGTHDDIVDAMAWAARMVSGHNPPPRLVNSHLPKGHVSWRQRVLTLMRANGSEKNFMSR